MAFAVLIPLANLPEDCHNLMYLLTSAMKSGGMSNSHSPKMRATSAIDEVAWGWTIPDVFRAVLPGALRPYVDRGWALEEKWSWMNKLNTRKRPRVDTYLSDWVPEAGKVMPGLLLNATMVEPGRPLVFSTTAFPCPNDSRGLMNFYDLYPNLNKPYDIRVNTAHPVRSLLTARARLSTSTACAIAR